ncbi:hypothetical protein PENTCL1PPCAC_14692, partial [Pristionchus entomophagus]
LALAGFVCNLTAVVVISLKLIPSLKESFGALTLSQAVADCIHQAIFAFYLVPCLLLRNEVIYSWSEQFGFTLICIYNVCGTAHVSISANRFLACYAPFVYEHLFSKRNTRLLIGFYWMFGIVSTTVLLKILDCSNFLKHEGWVFGFKDTPTCQSVQWYVEFIKYVIYVAIVAVFDSCSILRIHVLNIRFQKNGKTPASSAMKSAERNLVYQAALQGIFFLLELITYFILSPLARNKWELFLLTTVSWCIVHAMDGSV